VLTVINKCLVIHATQQDAQGEIFSAYIYIQKIEKQITVEKYVIYV